MGERCPFKNAPAQAGFVTHVRGPSFKHAQWPYLIYGVFLSELPGQEEAVQHPSPRSLVL